SRSTRLPTRWLRRRLPSIASRWANSSVTSVASMIWRASWECSMQCAPPRASRRSRSATSTAISSRCSSPHAAVVRCSSARWRARICNPPAPGPRACWNTATSPRGELEERRSIVRHLPNLICLLRIALVWPIVTAIAEGAYPRALLLFFVAAVSDGLDGFLAKRFHWTSELGKFLDPAADKILLIAVFLVATWYGLIPHTLTGIAVARDVMIVLDTLMQALYVIGVVAHAAFGLPPPRVLQLLAIVMLLTVLISGYAYAAVFSRRALEVARA